MLEYRPLKNLPSFLAKLRTKYRVPAPKFARHPVIRAAKKALGLPVYFHDFDYIQNGEVVIDRGSAPSDTIYTGGALYAGPDSQNLKSKNNLLHDLCHAMVAKPLDKMGYDNFYSTQWEEVRSCRIEFWLGFASGYYTLGEVVHYIKDYSFDSDVDYSFETGLMEADSVLSFLKDCRKEAFGNATALQVSRQVGCCSLKTLEDRFRRERNKISKGLVS